MSGRTAYTSTRRWGQGDTRKPSSSACKAGSSWGSTATPRRWRWRARGLQAFGEKLIVLDGNIAEIDTLHAASGLPPADGLLADLGVSSMQIEDASRGFSFNLPGPLDMRMNPSSGTTAEEIVNRLRERDLADLIFKFGEERYSRRIARAIVEARPIRKTTELAQVVTRAIPSRAGLHQIHPATRTFHGAAPGGEPRTGESGAVSGEGAGRAPAAGAAGGS